VSWQIVPKVLYELIGDPDREKSQRVMAAMLKVKKIEIAELERAAAAAWGRRAGDGPAVPGSSVSG
jgi:hypothetical protein